MNVKFNAAYDGIRYIVLVKDADLKLYQHVESFDFDMKPSGVFSLAQADALVTAMPSTKEINGQRSSRAEERVMPLAYVKVHLTKLTRDSKEVDLKTVTVEYLADLGLGLLNYVYAQSEVPGPDFLLPVPPSTGTDGEKAIAPS